MIHGPHDAEWPNTEMSEPQHPNAAIARRAWNAVSRADGDSLSEILAPGIVWHATGATPWRGVHRGIDAVLDYLARVGELTETFDASLVDVLTSADRVLLFFHVIIENETQKTDLDYLLLARLRDGLTHEVWTSPLDPEALARLWNT